MPYYAVAKGHVPGIYRTWADCLNQIRKYSGCDFRKRFCHADALKFMEYRKVPKDFYDCGIYFDDPEDPSNYYYAVAVGWNPGIYSSWLTCKEQVRFYPRAKSRKFCCAQDAENFLRRYRVHTYYSEFKDKNRHNADDKRDADDAYWTDDEENSICDCCEEDCQCWRYDSAVNQSHGGRDKWSRMDD